MYFNPQNLSVTEHLSFHIKLNLLLNFIVGSINGASRSWRYSNNVVPAESTMGHDHGWFHDESKSPNNVGLSHGIPSVTNASTTLSGFYIKIT